MSKSLLAFLIVVSVTVSACTNESQTSDQSASTKSSTVVESQPVKDCTYFRELALKLQDSANESNTKIITKDLTEQWTYVIMNHSRCFSTEEYCNAIDAHNSVSLRGRQESSPEC